MSWLLLRLVISMHGLSMKFKKKVVQKIETEFNNFFFFENHAVCEKMWKNIVESGRPQNINDACALHAEYLRLQTHIQNM